MSRFWIAVETAAGDTVGDGPIITAVSWRNVSRLDRAGEFSFEMPASDPRSALLAAKRIVRCYGQMVAGEAITELGAGVIDSITVRPQKDGSAMLAVAGGDLLRELTYRSVGFLSLTDGAGGPTATALAQIIACQPTWGLDPAGYATTGFLDYAALAGESVLSAFVRLAEHNGQHLRTGVGRTVRWLRGGLTDSGIRAIQGGDGAALAENPEVCLIQTLEEAQDSYDLITRIYGYGAGNANSRLTLAKCSRTAPGGWTLDKVNSCLINDTAEATYGRIERYLSWKDVAPISNSDTDIQSAANVLYDTMFAQLNRDSAPQFAYRLSVAGLQSRVYPGETIRAIYHRWVDGYHAVNIDNDLCILEATTQIDGEGLRTVALAVSTVDAWPTDSAELAAAELERGRFMEAHPQLTIAYSPVGPYTRRMDSTHPAGFTVRIGKEVTNLNYAILRFKTGPLVSSVVSVGGSSGGGSTGTSASGGGSTPTSSSSGGSTPTSNSAPHEHNLHVGAGAVVYPIGLDNDGLNLVNGSFDDDYVMTGIENSGSGHNHTVSVPAHTHDVSVPSHTHDVTIPAHTHTSTAAYGIYADTQYPTGIHITIDGTDRTTALGGPWAAGGGAATAELEITSYLEVNLRSNHTINFSCTSGQGECETEVDLLVSIQAVAMV